MVRKRELSLETLSALINLWQEKYSIGKIAKKFKTFTSMVWSIIKKKVKIESVVNRKRSDRQRITSATEDRRITTTSKRNRLLASCPKNY